MREGIAGLSREDLSPAARDERADMTRWILLQRLHTRNERFSFPVTEDRFRAIHAGDIEAMEFDHAGLEQPDRTRPPRPRAKFSAHSKGDR